MSTVLDQLELIREKATKTMSQINEKALEKMSQVISVYKSRMEEQPEHEAEAEPETSVETPKAKATVETKTRAGLNGGVNRSQLIRDFFEKNRSARNKDAVEFLKKEHGIEVGAALVSSVRANLGLSKSGKQGRKGAKAPKASGSQLIRNVLEKNRNASNDEVVAFLKSKGVHVSPKLVSSVRMRVGLKPKRKFAMKPGKVSRDPLPVMVARALKGNRDGLKIVDVAEIVVKAGYPYKGKRGRAGVIQNVYQTLRALNKKKSHPGWEGTTPVVDHDKATKRWKLNPKAKRSA